MNEPDFRIGDDGEIEYTEPDIDDEKPKRKSKQDALIRRQVTLRIPFFLIALALIIPLVVGGAVVLQVVSQSTAPATTSVTEMQPKPDILSALSFCSDAPLLSTNDRIVFSAGDMLSSNLFLTDPSSEHACRLTQGAYHNDYPTWSPDGRRIAFSSTREGRVDLFVMNANGINIRNLTPNCRSGSAVPDWSPDGKQILFDSSCFGETESNIYVMNADGSSIRQLTRSAGRNDWPKWSPDGSHIIFVSTRDGVDNSESGKNFEIYIMDSDGRDVRRMTHNQIFDSFPTWSARGDVVLYESTQADNTSQLMWNWDPFGYGSTESWPPVGSMPPFSPYAVWLQNDIIAFVGNFDGIKGLYTSNEREIRDQHTRVTNFSDIEQFDWWQRSQ